MKAPFLDEAALSALAETGRPGRRPAGGGLGPALALSLALHLTAAVMMGFGLARGGGEPGGLPGPLVMTVSLIGGAGGEAGDAPEEAPEEAPSAAPPEPEVVSWPEAEKQPEIAPDPEAFALKAPEPVKARPKPPETVRAASQEGRGKPRAGPPSPAGPAAAGGPAGSGAGGGGGDTAGYLKGNYEYIKKRIRQHLVYHPQAKRLGIQGTVTVAFVIGADGQARNAAVTRTSGHGMLDESALRAVQSASPFPPPPNTARIVVPISFSLK